MRDLAIGLSVANLCFIEEWASILGSHSNQHPYFNKQPTMFVHVTALGVDVVLLGVLVMLAVKAGRRVPHPGARTLLHGLLLAGLLIPLHSVARLAVAVGASQWSSGFRAVTPALAVVGVLVVLGVLVSGRAERVVRLAGTAMLLLAPFAVLVFAQGIYGVYRHDLDREAFRPRVLAPPVESGRSGPRVVWFVFDELDQRTTFVARPAGIGVPALEQLRDVAIFATEAFPPASRTMVSLPALITGQPLATARIAAADDLLLRPSGAATPAKWSRTPTVFSRARERGVNSALIGWYHPYCRILAPSLTRCAWFEAPSGTVTIPEAMLDHAASVIARGPFAEPRVLRQKLTWPSARKHREEHVARYAGVVEATRQALADPTLGLIFVHWPVPHKPPIYDRAARRISADLPQGSLDRQGYFDNLELADRAIAELRQSMERAGTWETTHLIVSSDHWWRDGKGFDGVTDRRVPFLLKLAGQRAGLSYGSSFNTVITAPLVLELLDGRLRDPEAVIMWLDRHRKPTA
jgi:hypothetical protein